MKKTPNNRATFVRKPLSKIAQSGRPGYYKKLNFYSHHLLSFYILCKVLWQWASSKCNELVFLSSVSFLLQRLPLENNYAEKRRKNIQSKRARDRERERFAFWFPLKSEKWLSGWRQRRGRGVPLILADSVTRLDDFWKPSVTNSYAKVVTIFSDLMGCF